MPQWQRTIRLKDVWDTKDIAAISASIHKQLLEMKKFDEPDFDGEREDLAYEFEVLSSDESATTADFDCLMDHLYDWGDTKLDEEWNGKKACWIQTF